MTAALIGSVESCSGALDPVSGSPPSIGTITSQSEGKQNAVAPGRNLDWCNIITLREIGAPPPARPLQCIVGSVSSLPIYDVPSGAHSGSLCGTQMAAARFRVTMALRVRIGLVPADFKLTILAPDGTHVADMDSTHTCLELDMEPGIWLIQVTSRSTTTSDDAYYFYISSNVSPSAQP